MPLSQVSRYSGELAKFRRFITSPAWRWHKLERSLAQKDYIQQMVSWGLLDGTPGDARPRQVPGSFVISSKPPDSV
jgi:hypothetical protein